MNILIINQHCCDVIGGSEIQCDIIATHLTGLGHEVTYLAVNGKQPDYTRLYRVITDQLTRKKLREIVLQYRPDVVYWRYNIRRFLPSMLVLKQLGIPVVFAVSHIYDLAKWTHRVELDGVKGLRKLKRFGVAAWQMLVNRINTLGFRLVAGTVVQLQDQSGLLPVQREVIIANSVNAATIPFQWKKPFVVWISTIKARKHPEIYLDIARQCTRYDVNFLVIGPIQQEQYQYFSTPSNLPPNVHYLGRKSYAEVNGILQQSLFLVHTCEPEGFPNVFIQAWMQAKPVVSLWYDPDSMIRKQNIGKLSGSVEQLLRDTQELLGNQELSEAMGLRARQLASGRFEPGGNVKKLADFLETVL